MSYNPPDMLSKCAAQWLDLNPYFNGGKISEVENRVKIERLPSIAYPPENLHLYFKLTDPDGLYHIRFLHLYTMMHSCKTLSGEQAIVKIDTATISGKERVNIQTVDRNGNARYAGWFNFGDIEPYMVLDISPGGSGVDDGLIGYWTFDEAAGKYAFDVSGNGSYAQLSGGTSMVFNGGKIGGALQLDGKKKNATVVNGADLINGLRAFTLSLWVKSSKVNTDSGFIFPKTPNGKDEIFSMRYDTEGSVGGGTNVIKVGVTTTAGVQTYESASDVQTTEWQHIALTWQSGRKLALYINGTLDKSTFNSEPTKGEVTGVGRLLIGRGGKDRNRSWAGLIDDVHLYNRVLNDKEIRDMAFIESGKNVSHGVALTGMCNVTPETIKANADIEYILTVTNTGNVQDTITLEVSGNTETALSSKSVSLAPGISSKVTLVVQGSLRKTTGDYVGKVTATSGGDNIKTAQITITTSI